MMEPGPQKKARRILVVEDHPELMRIMRLQLQVMGYDTLAAGTGAQAVELALQHLPDLITLDITLPDMDGLEAARKIRAHPATSTVPILAVTARSLPEHRQRCIEGGCTDYLSKPFTSSILAERIQTLLA